MGFNVNALTSSINQSGVAQASHFDILISYDGGEKARELSLRADTVNIPGRTISTLEHRFTNYGPLQKIPYSQMYGDLQMSFLMSEDLREKDYFERWHDNMVNTGAYDTSGAGRYSQFNTKYYEDYVATIEIRQYGPDGGTRTIHKINDAYPILIGEVGMDWASGDLMKLQVTFAFKNYQFITVDNSNQSALGLGFSFNLSKGGKLQASLRVPELGSIGLKKPPLGAIIAASPQLINNASKYVDLGVKAGKSLWQLGRVKAAKYLGG